MLKQGQKNVELSNAAQSKNASWNLNVYIYQLKDVIKTTFEFFNTIGLSKYHSLSSSHKTKVCFKEKKAKLKRKVRKWKQAEEIVNPKLEINSQ